MPLFIGLIFFYRVLGIEKLGIVMMWRLNGDGGQWERHLLSFLMDGHDAGVGWMGGGDARLSYNVRQLLG